VSLIAQIANDEHLPGGGRRPGTVARQPILRDPDANSPRRRQRQHAFVYRDHSSSLFAPILMRELQFSGRAICSPGRNTRQPRLESLLDAFSIGRRQTIFGAENPVSPICRFPVRLNLSDFGGELVA
jgi:hypothetical protein